VALALGENRDEHVGAGHLVAAGRLHVNDRALDDALEAGCGLGILPAVSHKIGKLAIDVIDKVAAKNFDVDVAGAHDGCRVLIVDEGKKKVFEGRVLVSPLPCESKSSVKGLFKTARKARQWLVLCEQGLS
jgi:hypothetical protein